MLVQGKAYPLLLMCLSMLCPAKMAALEQAGRPAEKAMAYLNIRLKIRAIHYGPASRIVLAVVLVELLNMMTLKGGGLLCMAMVGLMVVMVVDRLIRMEYKMRLAVLAVYMVVVMVEMPQVVSIMVQMQLIMVLAAAVVPTILVINSRSATAAAAIKA